MGKDYKGSEKRKFKRIVFSAKDDVMGVVTFPEKPDDPIFYKISDIGAGGLRFILPKSNAPEIISFNDTLFLREIKGKSPLEMVAGVQLEVRWVMHHEMFDHMVIGCEFVDLAEDVSRQIDEFVEAELARQNLDQ